MVFEEHPTGRIFERTHSGDEIDWGVVTIWALLRRLGYLWHIGKGPEDATDVTITFDENDDGSTCVEIVHSGWERPADGQPWRDANAGGWNAILPSFTSAVDT